MWPQIPSYGGYFNLLICRPGGQFSSSRPNASKSLHLPAQVYPCLFGGLKNFYSSKNNFFFGGGKHSRMAAWCAFPRCPHPLRGGPCPGPACRRQLPLPRGRGDGVRPCGGKKINRALSMPRLAPGIIGFCKFCARGPLLLTGPGGRVDSVAPKNFTHSF